MAAIPKYDSGELNDISARKILEARAKNLTISACAKAAGISKSLLLWWLEQGRQGRAEYATFLTEWEEVEAQQEKRLEELIEAAAPKDWKAAAWILERKFRARWGKATQDTQPVQEAAPTQQERDEDLLVRARSLVETYEAQEAGKKVG